MPANDKRTLGRTGLKISRLGLGSSYGSDEAMVLDAYDQGINYFYWGALRTRGMGRALKTLAQKHRDDIVIAVQAGAIDLSIASMVKKNLKKLGLDYFDILLLGWEDDRPSKRRLDAAHELKEQGYVNWLGVSAHQRSIFVEFEKERLFDVFHVRYNAAHRGAEKEVFAQLDQNDRPGVVAYTCTRWGGLLRQGNMPSGEKAPSASECYSFALSHNSVDCAITGPNSLQQLRENALALESDTMPAEDLARMRRIGDHVYQNVRGFADNVRAISSINIRRFF